jgi:hypothetical protein
MISVVPSPYLMATPKNLYDRGVGENLDFRDDKVRNNQDEESLAVSSDVGG